MQFNKTFKNYLRSTPPTQFVYENNIYPYDYIVMKINNAQEFNELENFLLKTVDFSGDLKRDYDLPNYLFIPNDLRLDSSKNIQWLDMTVPDQDMIDSYIINSDNTDGTYLEINDLDKLKNLLLIGKPKKIPNYKPKKFIYEKRNNIQDALEIAVQINGKVRDKLILNADISNEDAIKKAKDSDKVKKWLLDKKIVKEIYVKEKLVSLVIKD